MAKPDPIDALLLEGINSGPGTPLTAEDWMSIRQEGLGIIADRKREQARQAERDRIDALLVEGLESGPATPMTAGDWEEIRREVHRRHDERSRCTDGSQDRSG